MTTPERLVIRDKEDLKDKLRRRHMQMLPPVDTWDVSNVTDMSKLFDEQANFNEPINNWDVSNVTNMMHMFNECSNFNQPLDKWNTSKVKSMDAMFTECHRFNQPLNNWNVSNVENMRFGKLISGCFKTLFKDVLIPLKKSVGGFTSFSIPYNI